MVAESDYTGAQVEIKPEMVSLHEGKVLLDVWPQLWLSGDEARKLGNFLLSASALVESVNKLEVKDARFPGAEEL